MIKQTLFITLIFCAALISGCEKTTRQYSYSIFAFGTLIDITLYDVDSDQADTAFEQLQQDFDYFHQHWSPWTDGNLATLNTQLSKANNQAIPIYLPEDLIPLIKLSITLSAQSDNYYNPTIGNLINLWQFHKYQDNNIHPPEDGRIKTLVRDNPRMSDLSFNKNNQLLNKNTAVSLNFGAFAKGYAIELEMKRLQHLNIHNAVINAGGDLSVIGQHGDRLWNIGIRHPRNNTMLASIEIQPNESIFTSGDYERVYHFKGTRFHHILDPRTGYPTQDAQSVTVLHEDAGRADAAATALFVAGRKNWQKIAKTMDIDHVMLIDSNGDIHLTPAMEKRIKFLNKSSTSHIFISEQL
ncbi:MAG: FAD:protein FMN transferase [Gammaproteobacteria bacterium]|nr:FAD:protein FMN transferase [Gammaproteobacteria bacterium]